jgi:hypothetical protein
MLQYFEPPQQSPLDELGRVESRKVELTLVRELPDDQLALSEPSSFIGEKPLSVGVSLSGNHEHSPVLDYESASLIREGTPFQRRLAH